MATGESLRAKVTQVLQRTQVSHLDVYFRQVTSSGGNALLGVGRVRSNSDTLVSPVPVVAKLTAEEVASGGSLIQLGDYRILFDGNVSETTLKTNEIVYGTEVLKVVSYEPIVYQRTVVGWTVIARTAKAS